MAEEREYLSISGARIKLRPLHHSASCRELQVRGPRLQLGSLTAVTCCVWLVAYGLFVVSQVPVRSPLVFEAGPEARNSLRLGEWGAVNVPPWRGNPHPTPKNSAGRQHYAPTLHPGPFQIARACWALKCLVVFLFKACGLQLPEFRSLHWATHTS